MEGEARAQEQVTLRSLVRHQRIELGLDKEALGGPEFSLHYVEALERDAITPSRLALQLIARRLKMQPGVLAAAITTPVDTDITALEEDVSFQLNYAKMLQRENRYDEALSLIDEIEAGTSIYRDKLPGSVLYRIPFMRGRGYLMLQEFDRAQQQFTEALELAKEDIVAATTVRNLMGNSFYEEEKPDLALKCHLQCLRAIQSGAVKDPNLKVSILRNIALDYFALNDMASSIRFSKEALDALRDLDDPQREAAVHWGISRAYQDQGELDYARLHVKRAMDIYEKMDMPLELAQVSINMAELLIPDGRFEEATALLDRSIPVLENAQGMIDQGRPVQDELTGSVMLGLLYKTYADLERARGDLDKAVEYMDTSLAFTEKVCRQVEETGKSQPASQFTHAEGLWMAALIAEDRGDRATADSYFAQALEYARRAGFEQSEAAIKYSYAETLTKRGEHEQANKYYQAALQSKMRHKRRA